MKKTLFFTSLMISSLALSQVGINTSSPASTLDVTAKNSTGTDSNVDGLLIPRVDRQRAQSMNGVPISTLIYVNSIATGDQSGTGSNIDALGYYYFDGSAWIKFSNSNIYNSDGTLTGNRVVTQGSNTLAFNGTATNAFSVDGGTLSVDAANDRLGVGTTTPNNKLDLGTASGATTSDLVGKKLALYNNATGTDFYGLGISPGVLQFHAASTPTEEPSMVLTTTGNLGVGNVAPTAKLDVAGKVKITDGTQGAGKLLVSDANGLASWQTATTAIGSGTFWNPLGNAGTTPSTNFLGTTDNQDLVVRTNNIEKMRITAGGNVGIGTATPNNKLEISSGVANESGMKFNNINSVTPASGSGKALGVDTNGKVVMVNVHSPSAAIVADNVAPNVGSGTDMYWMSSYNHPGGMAYITAMATCWVDDAFAGSVPSAYLKFEIRNASNVTIATKSSILPNNVPKDVRISMPPMIYIGVNLPAGVYTLYIYKGDSYTYIDGADVASISVLSF